MSELTVIEGGGEDAGPPVCTINPDVKARACWHPRVELDGKARKVLCKECGVERDPFDALLVLADKLERYKDWGTRYKGEAKRAKEELDDLKRQVRNAKAQLRRAEGKQ
jgi:hypothetical protein